ncbi:hypothetical protein AMTR_s00006p00091380 [Amborella trichopoda]|uniref:Uncharacterized protein n=1 Tax=Amborella trichopoda TaxID=13333 RepID=W1PD62_AMBTC|nr:hypothetical protein AMTR_s00006p00091380 [Amborella trichopoda]
MAWQTCLDLSGLRVFALDHPWQKINSSKRDGRVGKRFTPPPFSQVFRLDYYPTDWKELAKPRFLDKDETGMKNLSRRGEIKSFFDNLILIFVGTREGVASGSEEDLPKVQLLWGDVGHAPTELTGPSAARGGSLSIDPVSRNARLGLDSRGRNDCGMTWRTKFILIQFGVSIRRPFLGSRGVLREETPTLGVPPSGLAIAPAPESSVLEVYVGDPSSEPFAVIGESLSIVVGDPVLEIPPLNVIDYLVPAPSPPDAKALLARWMLRTSLQVIKGGPLSHFKERVEATPKWGFGEG